MALWKREKSLHRLTLRPTDAAHCIRKLHASMEGWGDSDGWHLLRLALHEWTANMLQHATFGPRRPRLTISVKETGRRIEAIVEDNSDGFEFHAVPKAQFQELPDRGMGVTLVRMCSNQVEYDRQPGKNTLFFTIPLRAEQLSLIPRRPLSLPVPNFVSAA